VPTHTSEQSAFAELRLALRAAIHVAPIAFQHFDDLEDFGEAIGKRMRNDTLEIVRGGVVLREAAVRRARKDADRQIEARRTVLTFVVAVRTEIPYRKCGPSMLQDVSNGPIDQRIAPPAALVCRLTAIAKTGEDQAVPNSRHHVFVAAEPRDRADRGGN